LSIRPTVGVSRWWAGWDSAGEQKKLEARKMLENAAESHQSAARFVGQARLAQDSLTENPNHRQLVLFYLQLNFWQSSNLKGLDLIL